MDVKLNYVEFASSDLVGSRSFFERVFYWEFQHYGDEYIAFSNAGLEGGFYYSERVSLASDGAPLLVFYSEDLESTLDQVKAAGASISQTIFEFPGGRRFHFIEPGGNELAVWSDKPVAEKET